MSAWVTSKAHIDAMVTKAIAMGGSYEPHGSVYFEVDGTNQKIEFSPHTANKVGQMLRDTIVTGVNHRYPSDDASKGELPGPSGGEDVWYVKPYEYEKTRELWDGETVSLIGCYEYQASEHEKWRETFGYVFCEYVRTKLLDRLLKAWERQNASTPWGYEDEHVFPGFDKWAVVMRGEFRPNCGGPLVLVPARNIDEAMTKAAAWYDGEPIAAAIHPGDLLPEEIEAETKRNVEWLAERAKPAEEAEEIPAGFTPYAVWLTGTEHGLVTVRVLGKTGNDACESAVTAFGGEAYAYIEHIAPLPSPAPATPPEDATILIRRPTVKALDPEVNKLLEELASLGDPEGPSIRNNRK